MNTEATSFTCKTPEEAGLLADHYIRNAFTVIAMRSIVPQVETEFARGVREGQLVSKVAELIGHYSMLFYRMRTLGHKDTASWLEEILEMLTTGNLTDKAVRDRILARLGQLNPEREP